MASQMLPLCLLLTGTSRCKLICQARNVRELQESKQDLLKNRHTKQL